MAIHKSVEEHIYIPKESTFEEVYFNDGLMRLLLNIVSIGFVIIGSLIILFTSSYDSYKTAILMIIIGILTLIGIYIALNMTEMEKSKVLSPNKKGAKYLLSFGVEIFQHLGSGPLSLTKKNLTGRIFLVSAEIVKRMGAVIGTTGSGKTIFLKGLLEQQTALGGGWFSMDAKGTVDELKNIYALVAKYMRLKDLYVINFANQNNSHSIAVLKNGSALMLKEIMSALIENNDPKWKKVDEDFMEAVLKLLVYKRDNEGLTLTFSEIGNYMTLDRLLSEAWMYKRVDDIFVQDFVKYVTTKLEVDYNKFVKADENDKEFFKHCKAQSQNSDLQGVYEAGLAAGNWQGILTTLGSNYGKILNVPEPDIDLFEAVQNNKMIWIVLPTMESEDTAKRLGKLFLGLIKSVADRKIKKSFEPKIPFLFLLDEFGSFAIVGFGRFMSKARSLGMSVWLFFQSQAQLDVVDDGKGLERKECMDMCNSMVILKNKDSELAEYISKIVPQNIVLERSYKEKRGGMLSDNSDRKEEDYQNTKEDAMKAYDFFKLKDGEAYFIFGEEYYKGVTTSPTDFKLTYKKYDIDVEFPLVKLYPKQKFINELRRYRPYIFERDLIYLITL